MQFDPHQLAALCEVLRCGSFDTAATNLSVTASAVSQRIKALEERVGTQLVRRSTPCVPTTQGRRIARHAETVRLLETQLSRELSINQPRPGRVSIAVNSDSLHTWFPEALAQVDDLLFDIQVDDQDHSSAWMKRGEVSAVICARDAVLPGCDVTQLGAMRYVACASPVYIARWLSNGITPQTLAHAPCLMFNAKDGLQTQWMEAQGAHRAAPPSHMIPSTKAFVDACVNGMGWGLQPEPLVKEHIDSGRLVTLGPGSVKDVHLIWQVSRVVSTALAPVTKAVQAAAQKSLRQG